MSDLDRLIDAVGQEMTSAEPTVDLRARVMTQLERRRDRRWLWITGGLAAAGAVVLLVFASLQDQPAPKIPTRTAQSDLMEPRAFRPGDVPAAEAAGLHLNASTPRTARRKPQVARVASPEELAWQARAIPALEPPNPIVLEEIQPEPLEIRPLVMPALDVPAIGEGEQTQF